MFVIVVVFANIFTTYTPVTCYCSSSVLRSSGCVSSSCLTFSYSISVNSICFGNRTQLAMISGICLKGTRNLQNHKRKYGAKSPLNMIVLIHDSMLLQSYRSHLYIIFAPNFCYIIFTFLVCSIGYHLKCSASVISCECCSRALVWCL